MSEKHISVKRTVRPRRCHSAVSSATRRERFYNMVMKAINALPLEFRDKLENVDVVVADWPTRSQLAKTNIRNQFGLLGLYEGVPHTKRGRGYEMVLPDKITIFQKPIEARCRSWRETEEEIGRVVRHEIAHHFGTEEQRLRIIESSRPRTSTG